MICCKIVADYEDPKGSLSKLFNNLANYGTFLLEEGALFFGDTENEDFTQKNVESILKKAGYKKFLVLPYDKQHPPKENDYINGWITDKLIRINYNTYEKQSQKLFRDISLGLDELDKELDALEKQALSDGASLMEEGQE